MDRVRTGDVQKDVVAKILAARRAGYSLGQIGKVLEVPRGRVFRAEKRAGELMEWLLEVEEIAQGVNVKDLMGLEEPSMKVKA